MTDLIHRAEQGVLAAMLQRLDQPEPVRLLEADDFGYPTHRDIYVAIVDTTLAVTEATALPAAVAVAIDRADVTTQWLTELAANAPEATVAAAYARIVQEAAFERTIAGFAAPYTEAAELAADPITRAALHRLADTITAQADAFAAISDAEPGPAPTALTQLVSAELDREDTIIADLIQHPEHATAVASWLTSDLFSTEQRRITFEIVVSTGYHGDPIDALVLTYQLQHARALDALYERAPAQTQSAVESDGNYIARLAAATVATGAAITVGRDLLAEHVAASLAVSAAAAAERAATHGSDRRQVQRGVEQSPIHREQAVQPRQIEL